MRRRTDRPGGEPPPARQPEPAAIEPLALTMREVVAYVKLCRSTIERMIATGAFPRSRKVGAKVLFDRREIEAWWQRQAAGEDAESQP